MHQCPMYKYKIKLPNVTFLVLYSVNRGGDENQTTQKMIRTMYFNVCTCM